MKELEGAPFSIETKLNAEQKIESKLIGRVYLKPGQFMYVYDPRVNKMEKLTLKQVQFEQGVKPVQEIKRRFNTVGSYSPATEFTIYEPSGKHMDTIHSQASWDSSKMYCVAINDKNASKKFAKMLFDLTTQKVDTSYSNVKNELEI